MSKEDVFVNALALTFAIAIILIAISLIWMLWCLVLPSLWPLGPLAFTHPGFWPFAGLMILFAVFHLWWRA